MRSQSIKILVIMITMASGSKMYAQAIDSELEFMVAVAKQELQTPASNPVDPLALSAKLVWSEKKDQLAIVLKVNLFRGWHIYSSVSRKSPFIASRIKLSLPEGIAPLGEWEKPNAEAYNQEAHIYVGEELFFVRYYKVDDGVELNEGLKCGLYYQACDPYKCFPPKTKMVNLSI